MYPAVVLLLGGLGSEVSFLVMLHPSIDSAEPQIMDVGSTESPLNVLFSTYTDALSSRAFTGVTRSGQAKLMEKWVDSWLECLAFLVRRIVLPYAGDGTTLHPARHAELLLYSPQDAGKANVIAIVAQFIKEQVSSVCQEVFGLHPASPVALDEEAETAVRSEATVRIDSTTFGDIISNFLLGLLRLLNVNEAELSFFDAAFEALETALSVSGTLKTPSNISIPSLLKSLSSNFPSSASSTTTLFPPGALDHASRKVNAVLQDLLGHCLDAFELAVTTKTSGNDSKIRLLIQMIHAFGDEERFIDMASNVRRELPYFTFQL